MIGRQAIVHWWVAGATSNERNFLMSSYAIQVAWNGIKREGNARRLGSFSTLQLTSKHPSPRWNSKPWRLVLISHNSHSYLSESVQLKYKHSNITVSSVVCIRLYAGHWIHNTSEYLTNKQQWWAGELWPGFMQWGVRWWNMWDSPLYSKSRLHLRHRPWDRAPSLVTLSSLTQVGELCQGQDHLVSNIK